VLDISRLSVRYGPALAVNDVSFNTGDEMITTILGTNGAGKTTMGMAIAGLIPSKGRISLDGVRIDGLSPTQRVRAGIVYVPEGRHVFSNLSVFDNLRAGAYQSSHRSWHERASRLVERMPTLRPRMHVAAGMLSGGEQQLLAIARALMTSPKLIILDEPSLGLSPMGVRDVRDTLQTLVKEEKVGLLLLEQNIRFSATMAKRGWVLRLGWLVAAVEADDFARTELMRSHLLGTGSPASDGEPQAAVIHPAN
jgi:branched-chain amino acid transport system ATP-binding protein